jgi:type 1 glutamine amidotransferase
LTDPVRNLILTGGVSHPFDTASVALADLLQNHGITSTITEDIDAGLRQLNAGEYDLLTVYALRWPMTNHERFAEGRPRCGYEIPQTSRDAITDFVGNGGPLLGLHTAAICFDDWPEWRDVLGATWKWDKSSHPPYGPVAARFEATDHPITRDLPDFDLADEVYGDLEFAPGIEPLMQARALSGDHPWFPLLWARNFGKGRVAFDGLGHDVESINHPVHRRIIGRAALWALGRTEEELATL